MTSRSDRVMTIKGVGAYLKVSRHTVYRFLNEGGLPAHRLTPGGHRRFIRAEVDAWIRERKVWE